MEGDIITGKQNLRTRMRQLRRERAGAFLAAGAAEAACTHWQRNVKITPDAVLAGYWPLADEMDPRPIMLHWHQKGGKVALPAVAGPNLPLKFRRWTPELDLIPGVFGLSEPPLEAAEMEPHILLLPLLAFDRQGYRLGFGGGYYDRTLAALRQRGEVRTMGLAFSFQEVEAIPADHFDALLDGVVTEIGTHWFGPPKVGSW